MLGLYVHIPFCSAICNYCNFNRGLFDAALKARYVDALIAEIGRSARAAGRAGGEAAASDAADTIYFGGGTPSLLEPDEIARIIAACRAAFDVAADREVTLEANPETVTTARLAGFRARRRQSPQFRCPVVPRRRAAPAVAAARRRPGPRGVRRGAGRRVRQRQPRPDDVAARAAGRPSGSSRSTRRSRSARSTCRCTCSRCIRTRRSRTRWRARAGRRRPTTMRRRCT